MGDTRVAAVDFIGNMEKGITKHSKKTRKTMGQLNFPALRELRGNQYRQ